MSFPTTPRWMKLTVSFMVNLNLPRKKKSKRIKRTLIKPARNLNQLLPTPLLLLILPPSQSPRRLALLIETKVLSNQDPLLYFFLLFPQRKEEEAKDEKKTRAAEISFRYDRLNKYSLACSNKWMSPPSRQYYSNGDDCFFASGDTTCFFHRSYQTLVC